jgi:hypothetical protein
MGIKSVTTLLVLAAILTFVSTSSAVSVGVSPGIMEFKDLLRGGYSEQEILVSTSGAEELSVSVSARGDIKEWLSFDPPSFDLEPKSRFSLKAIVQPPEDVANGVYEGVISVVARPDVDVEGTGVTVGAAAAIRTTIEVTDRETKEFEVMKIMTKDIEEGHPLEIHVVVRNTGNVRVTPRIHVDILDQMKQGVIKSTDYADTELLPTVEGTIIIMIPTDDLKIGQYWARVTVYLDNSLMKEELLTFDLLERGALRIKGALNYVRAGAWAEVGDLVEIDANFVNVGELITLAKARFEIFLNDTLREELFSEELQVGVGETLNLSTTYRPTEPGRYEIKGVVFYSKKLTEEKTTILNVEPRAEALGNVTKTPAGAVVASGPDYTVIIVILAVIIIVLLFLNLRKSGRGKKKASISR